jgi:hypothetical protein
VARSTTPTLSSARSRRSIATDGTGDGFVTNPTCEPRR